MIIEKRDYYNRGGVEAIDAIESAETMPEHFEQDRAAMAEDTK